MTVDRETTEVDIEDGETTDAETEGEMVDDLSTLLSSATLMLFVGSLGSVTRLLEQVLLGRVLTASAYGRVNIGISLLTFCTSIAMLGLGSGISRYMPRFDDIADVRGAWITGAVIAGGMSIVVSLALLVGIVPLRRVLFDEQTPLALVALFILTIPFFTQLEIAVNAIRGRENTIYRTYVRDLFYNVFRVGLLAALLVAGYGVVAAGYAYLIAAAVSAVIGYWLLNRLFSLVGSFNTHTREMMLFSLPLVVSSIVTVLLSQIDTLMLGALRPSADAGVYSAAYSLSKGVTVITSSFGFLYFPLTARLDADGKHSEVNRMYKATTKWVFVVSFPAVLCFVVFPDDLLVAVFGDYARGGVALAILSIGFFASAAQGRCQDTLSAFGFTTLILMINAGTAVFNVILNAALIPPFGVSGAAVASAISYVSLNTVALFVLWRRSGINPFSRWTVRTFVVLPAVLIPVSIALSQVFTLTLLTLLPFLVLTGLACIALLMATGSLQPEDEIPLDLIEGRLGVPVPLIRRYIPDEDAVER